MLAAGGRPLEPATRGIMEARFGHDLSNVRIHDDPLAASAATSLHAVAFTMGQHIAFGQGRYAPDTLAGQALLGHELAHTIQQRDARTLGPPVERGSNLEQRAADAGRAVATGRPVTHALGTSDVAIACELIGNEGQWMPDQLAGQDLVDFNRLWSLLKTKNPYPGRARDLARFEQLKAYASRRYDAHKKSVDEALAWVAQEDAEEKAKAAKAKAEAEEDEEAVYGQPKVKTPAKLDPGGYTRDDIYKESEDAMRAFDAYYTAKDPRHFEDRFKQARRDAPMTALSSDFYLSVWEYGLSKGLFSDSEENLVRDKFDKPRMEKAEQDLKRARINAEYQKRQRFDSFRTQLNLQVIQGVLLGGPKAPLPVRVPYVAHGTAHTARRAVPGPQDQRSDANGRRSAAARGRLHLPSDRGRQQPDRSSSRQPGRFPRRSFRRASSHSIERRSLLMEARPSSSHRRRCAMRSRPTRTACGR